MYEEQDLLFLAMDIPEELRKFINENEGKITKGMTTDQLRAYHLGVDNTISLLESLLSIEEEDFVVHIRNQKTKEISTEMTTKELCSIVENRMLAYTE